MFSLRITTASVYLCVQILSACPLWSISGCSSGIVIVSPSQVHSDINGPLPVCSPEGYQYWVSFIDDATCFLVVVLLHNKSEAFLAFRTYKAYVENLVGHKIKNLQDDKGGEYISKEFGEFLVNAEIARQHTVHGEPHQNGVAEHANRTLEESATAILTESHLPASFWGHAITALVHVRNRSPTAALSGDIPYTRIYGKKPNVSHLRVFGCTGYVHIKKDKRKGLSSHTEKCVFIGYPAEYKAWTFYNPLTKNTIISNTAEFDECAFPGLSKSLPPPSPPPRFEAPEPSFVEPEPCWSPRHVPEPVGEFPNQVGEDVPAPMPEPVVPPTEPVVTP